MNERENYVTPPMEQPAPPSETSQQKLSPLKRQTINRMNSP